MFKRLRQWFSQLGSADASANDASGSGAHTDDQEAPHYHHDRRAVKDQFTNHWDMDFMSREQLDEMARQQRAKDQQ